MTNCYVLNLHYIVFVPKPNQTFHNVNSALPDTTLPIYPGLGLVIRNALVCGVSELRNDTCYMLTAVCEILVSKVYFERLTRRWATDQAAVFEELGERTCWNYKTFSKKKANKAAETNFMHDTPFLVKNV